MSTVLAIETSAHIGAVCVLRDGLAFHETVRDNSKLSAWVIPAVERVLRAAGCTLPEVNAIAFGSGPGAFTGVRTACASAQALAYAHDLPLYAITSIEALAQSAISTISSNKSFFMGKKDIFVILDARMNELFSQRFFVDSSNKLFPESEITLSQVDAIALPNDAHTLGSGAQLLAQRSAADTALAAAINTLTANAENTWAHAIAHIAAERFARGEPGINPLHAEPTYVRNNVAKTEAERAASQSHKVSA